MCVAIRVGMFLMAAAILTMSGCHGMHSGIDGSFEQALVIAHRGASGYRPEHTLAAYQLAAEQGADFIEPDLVVTADGVLIARHDTLLAAVALNDDGAILLNGQSPQLLWATTDVASHEQFADRLTIKSVNGKLIAGWFVEDFTFAEIQQLRARERMADIRPKNRRYDDLYRVPSFVEILTLVAQLEKAGTVVGLYPETKYPSYFLHSGRKMDGSPIAMDTSALLVQALQQADFTNPERVFIQSFESTNLIDLAQRILPTAGIRLPLVQLVGARQLSDGAQLELEEVATYASGIGVHKRMLLEVAPDLVQRASTAGLFIHVYTLRAEADFVHPRFAEAGVEAELEALLALGVSGVFADQPDIARRVVDRRSLN